MRGASGGGSELSENGALSKEIAAMTRDPTYEGLESLGQTGNRLAKPPPEEPDAGNPHVRVCEGPGRQRPGLLGKSMGEDADHGPYSLAGASQVP